MKKITRPASVLSTLLLTAVLSVGLYAQNLTTPRSSPAATLKQTIGLTEIAVHYSRPQVIVNGKDRTGQIWGGLVPYGMQKVNFGCRCEVPWRAGANENTIFEISADLTVGGKKLPAGKYGLHMVIHENDRATLIFSHNTSSWGSFWYTPEEDALRVEVNTEEVPFTNVLTYDFVDLGADYGILALDWEKKRIPVKIEVNVEERVLASMRNELRGVAGFGWQGPLAAANYCLQNDFHHKEALQWVDRSIANNKNPQNLAVKAGLQAQMGKMENAAETAKAVGELSNVNQLNQIGYQMVNAGLVDLAIRYFQLNVEKNPDVANCYDSLGEGYLAKGEHEKAIQAFKTSLSKNPPEFVRNNSIKNLKKLGVEYPEN